MYRILTCLILTIFLGCSTTPKPAPITVEKALGLDNGPGPADADATSVPDNSFARDCGEKGDPGCLRLAARCKPVWRTDPICRPLVRRCSQGWLGAIAQACDLAFGDELQRINEEVDRAIELRERMDQTQGQEIVDPAVKRRRAIPQPPRL